MAEDTLAPPRRLVNFVSQEELDEAKRTRGERAEDGTAQRDRPLFDILKDNKDKKDAEFNERFKHRPPKALDEDETEFLDNLETTRKEYEQQIADQEALELQKFQAAVAAQSMSVQEINETTSASNVEEPKPRLIGKKASNNPIGMLIKVKPQAKKAKTDVEGDKAKPVQPIGDTFEFNGAVKIPLVSYSDESDED